MKLKNLLKSVLRYINELVSNLVCKLKLLKQGIIVNYKPGDWAIGWDDVLVLNEELKRYVQHGEIRYLEIGSGFSTVAVSKILSRNFTKSFIFSMEADLNWIESTENNVQRNLTSEEKDNLNLEFIKIDYDVDSISSLIEKCKGKAPFDVVFVDAPPDTTMPDARKKVISLLYEMLGEKGTLIVHDTNRNDEMYAVQSIRNNFLSVETVRTKKGITILRFPILRKACI